MTRFIKVMLLILIWLVITSLKFEISNMKIAIGNSLFPISNPKIMGEITAPEINEASGIAVSKNNPGALWVHNDNGDVSRIFLISENGSLLKIYLLDNIFARDWEDMSSGPGPRAGINYLYVGDIGDNKAQDEIKYIYRFPEPDLKKQNVNSTDLIKDFETIIFRYPDGLKDAETLMVDPLTKDIYVVSKAEFKVHVYVARYPQAVNSIITVEKVAELPFPGAVSGDISRDGNHILIKTYSKIFYWHRENRESLSETFKREPRKMPYQRELQGEAVCWDLNTRGYYTLSERVGQDVLNLYYYSLK